MNKSFRLVLALKNRLTDEIPLIYQYTYIYIRTFTATFNQKGGKQTENNINNSNNTVITQSALYFLKNVMPPNTKYIVFLDQLFQ